MCLLFHCTVGGEPKVLLSNRVLFHFFSGFSSGDILKKMQLAKLR